MPKQSESGRVVRGQPIDPVKLARAKEMRRAMTPAETLLWKALRTNQFHGYHFRRQQVIAGFIVDFYCHAARLAVEVDGAAHTGQEAYDAERDQVLAGHDVRALRIPNEDVERRLPDVLTLIAAHLSPNPSPNEGGEPKP
jgi:very-short-patch-repair endonuclease